jgi:hypothetical protein
VTAGQRARSSLPTPPPTPASKIENARRAPPLPTPDRGRKIALMN